MIIPTIKFVYDRRHVADKQTKGSIELRVTHERIQKYLTTGITCYPHEWDAENECVKSLTADEDNANLLRIRRRALKVIGEMVDAEKIDINAIPDKIRQKSLNITFIEYIFKRINDRQVATATKKSYKAFLARFADYGKINTFSDITEKNIRGFDDFLHRFRWKEVDRFGQEVSCQYSQASIGHFHKKLKLFIGDAIVDGYLTENPYLTKRIKIDRGGTRRDQYLTEEELHAIMKAKMPTASIQEARDLFVFQSLTGLAYSDLMEFDFTHVETDGKFRVYTSRRQKTNVEFTFVLIPEALAILKKYHYHLPHMPNQKYNLKLKIVADAAGIEKNLTTHVGRRTAGSIWLNKGVPIAVVAKCMGHSSITTTQQSYVKILDKTVVQAFEEHIIKRTPRNRHKD